MLAIIFILFKLIMFNIIFKFFIRDIDDYEIRKKIMRDITIIN